MNDWILTYSGTKFRPLDPNPADISLVDIAHALSNICRFTGHSKQFYSVAQHSIIVSDNLPPELKLAGLLHDASEAYICDVSRPVKHSEALSGYRDIEEKVMNAVAKCFRVRFDDPRIKEADNRALWTERRDLMPPYHEKFWYEQQEPYEDRIFPWLPTVAEQQFINRATLLLFK